MPNKILDQYLLADKTYFKSNERFRKLEILKTFIVKLKHLAKADANADARGSTIALPELPSGEQKWQLKTDGP